MLVHSDIDKMRTTPGSSPCFTPCFMCKYMKSKNHAKSTSNQYTSKIQQLITCTSSNLIYLIECNLCQKQYIGQSSNSLQERMRGHLHDIKTANQFKPVSHHFTSANQSINNVTITGLLLTNSNVNVRLRTEESLIALFGTLEPEGLNCRYG